MARVAATYAALLMSAARAINRQKHMAVDFDGEIKVQRDGGSLNAESATKNTYESYYGGDYYESLGASSYEYDYDSLGAEEQQQRPMCRPAPLATCLRACLGAEEQQQQESVATPAPTNQPANDDMQPVAKATKELKDGIKEQESQPVTGTEMVKKEKVERDIMMINCPFIRVAINEGVAPKREFFTAEEGDQLINDTGLASFKFFDGTLEPFSLTKKIDLFDLEGNREEHDVSTGIFDCDSDFTNWESCPIDPSTQTIKCPTADRHCFKTDPNRQRSRWEDFWKTADKDGDGKLTMDELTDIDSHYKNNCLTEKKCTTPDDFHAGTGSIEATFALLIATFGESCNHISKAALESVAMNAKFPAHFDHAKVKNKPAACCFGPESDYSESECDY